jgi:hypothetical protein
MSAMSRVVLLQLLVQSAAGALLSPSTRACRTSRLAMSAVVPETESVAVVLLAGGSGSRMKVCVSSPPAAKADG